MPTAEEFEQLFLLDQNRKKVEGKFVGQFFFGPNDGDKIFIPVSEDISSNGWLTGSYYARCWTSSLDKGHPTKAYSGYIWQDLTTGLHYDSMFRNYGLPIRPVFVP